MTTNDGDDDDRTNTPTTKTSSTTTPHKRQAEPYYSLSLSHLLAVPNPHFVVCVVVVICSSYLSFCFINSRHSWSLQGGFHARLRISLRRSTPHSSAMTYLPNRSSQATMCFLRLSKLPTALW